MPRTGCTAWRRLWTALGTCAAVLAVGLPRSGAAAVDAQMAFEHSRGHYGSSELTTIRSATGTLRWRGEAAMVAVELPWLEVRTAAPGGGLPDQGGRGAQLERGQGDAWWRVELPLRDYAADQLGVDLLLKVKTASGSYQRGLGSGARDVAVQFDFTRRLGPVVGFAELGWRRTGDVPGVRRYHDPWYGEIGASFEPVPGWEAGAHLDVRQRIGSLGALRELTLYGSWRQGPQKLQWHLTLGNTRASVQQALGLSWRWRWP